MNAPQTEIQNETNINQDLYKGSAEKVEQLKPALLLLPVVRSFTLSVPWTISAAIRCWESYLADKPRFLEVFTPEGFDAAALEDYPLRVGVLWYLDGQLSQVVESSALAPELIAVARPLQTKLGQAAVYLFNTHPTLGPVVRDIRQGKGYLDMAHDLSRYALLFDEHWDEVQGRCDVTREDITAAGDVSVRMLTVLTDTKRPDLGELKDLRNRAGEYLCRGADTIRRAARYIFDDDHESMTRYPSLYRNRMKPRKRTSAEEPMVDETPEEPEI